MTALLPPGPGTGLPWYDSHAHLDDRAFATDRDSAVRRALEAGVAPIINPGTDYPGSLQAVELAARHEGVYAAVGVHPHDAKSFETSQLQELRHLACQPKVIAIGEIGLDYHYNFSPAEVQRQVFAAQLELARELGLPVILHCREAFPDFYALVQACPGVTGVMHCFSGDEYWAGKFMAAGFFFGVTGSITFKKAEALREVVRALPLERLLLETDSPYLAPHPLRGKRNEPAYIPNIAEALARIKAVPGEVLSRQLRANLEACFPRLQKV